MLGTWWAEQPPGWSPKAPFSFPSPFHLVCVWVSVQAWLLWKGITASFPPMHPLAASTERLVHLTWGDDWPWTTTPPSPRLLASIFSLTDPELSAALLQESKMAACYQLDHVETP